MSPGGAAPLVYLPLLNPLDITVALSLLSSYLWFKDPNHLVLQEKNSLWYASLYAMLGGVSLVWVTAILIRSIHHWFGVIFNWSAIYNSDLVQTSVTILWTLIAAIITYVATKKQLRNLWIIGMSLIGLVMLKLVFIDISSHDTLERIISFIGVGTLLLLIGYFAPLPKDLTKGKQHEDS